MEEDGKSYVASAETRFVQVDNGIRYLEQIIKEPNTTWTYHEI